MIVEVTHIGLCRLLRRMETGYAVVRPIGSRVQRLVGIHHVHRKPPEPFNGVRGLDRVA